jgi:hypothetical protein
MEELDTCHPLCRGIGMSVELADVIVSDVTVTNAAVGVPQCGLAPAGSSPVKIEMDTLHM